MENNYVDLKDVRFKNGRLSQADTAKKIGISTCAYTLIESKKRNGSVKTWKKIQEIFGLSDGDVWRLMSQAND